MAIVTTVVAFIVALGVLVTIHELGHYWVARWCGVKVLRFSVGFGKPLVAKRWSRDGTEWVIAAVPLGGYVKMADEREGPVAPQDLPRAFNRQSVYRRMAIVAAGPLANFMFAVLVYWGLFVHGVPGLKPVLGEPPAGTLAAQAGFQAGDLLVRIGSEPVTVWQDVRWMVMRAVLAGTPLEIEAETSGGNRVIRKLDSSRLSADSLEQDFLGDLGLTRFRPPLLPVLGAVLPGGAAEQGGLRPADRILEVDGRATPLWDDVVERVRGSPGVPLRFTVDREGRRLSVKVTPRVIEEGGRQLGRIGAGPRFDESVLSRYKTVVAYPGGRALAQALWKTWDTSWLTLRMLGKMLVGEVSPRNLSGPLTIADYAGQSAGLGVIPYLGFLALISVSLGVLNLLPVPVLDGGHMVYYMAEILKGSPVSERVMEVGQKVGVALLLALTALALFNDIHRLFNG